MAKGYSFTISESYTPKTIPLDRLAAYIAGVARLLGESANVHLDVIEEGSVAIRVDVDEAARPKVRDRVRAIRAGSAPKDALKAYKDLDDMLLKDNAVGTLAGNTDDTVVPFPGKRRPQPIVFGPFRQAGHLDGQVYRIEGKDDTKHVGVRDGDRDYGSLVTSEAVALRLRHHAWDKTLRFHGMGSWLRHGSGAWELKSFRIHDFEVLDEAPLQDLVQRLRAVKGSELPQVPDAVQRLLADRLEGDA
ncbi:MAG: hypothetical protein ACK4GG_07605 [Sphingomonas sp.]